MNKVLTSEELLRRRGEARATGRRVVQCHGCFDLVHPGHVRHLRQARALGDILLVSVTGDAEVGKGAARPLIPEELRAENLAALDCVDWVYIESRPTAAALLEEVRPDVYVKGREYEFNNDPRFRAEREIVERHGGRVVFSSGDVVFSSTALISAIEHAVDPFQSRLAALVQRPELSGPSLFSLIAGFRGRRVVVVGETILDTYVLCDRPHIAGESPVMNLRPLERRHYDGGAAIIARHVAAMGGHAVLVTALARDPRAEEMRRRLEAEGVEVRAIEHDGPLFEKQRFLVGAQKVMKLDLCEPLVLDAALQDDFEGLVRDAAGDGCDAAIVADFGQGLLTPALLGRVCGALRARARVLAGDVSGRYSGLRRMGSMDLLCPAEAELREAFGMTDESLPTLAWRLLQETGSRAAMITLGAEGLLAFEPAEGEDSGEGFRTRVRSEHVPALSAFAIDALGCGDALLAAAAMALASGGSLQTAAFLGSVAAAVEAQRVGNIPVSSTDLRQGVVRVHNAHLAFATPDVVTARTARAADAAVLRAS